MNMRILKGYLIIIFRYILLHQTTTMMKRLIVFLIFGIWSIACTPVTYNSGYYGKKKVVVKEGKYTAGDEKKKIKYYYNPEYRRKQIAKKTKH